MATQPLPTQPAPTPDDDRDRSPALARPEHGEESASPPAAQLGGVGPGAGIPQPAGRQRAFAYLDTESTHRYRQLMGVLLANKLRFGLRLSPAEIATRLWERFAARYESTEALERDLTALCDWGALDSHQDNITRAQRPRASSSAGATPTTSPRPARSPSARRSRSTGWRSGSARSSARSCRSCSTR
jgi:hypothetical protein